MEAERFWKRRILKEEEDMVKHILEQSSGQELVLGPTGLPMFLPKGRPHKGPGIDPGPLPFNTVPPPASVPEINDMSHLVRSGSRQAGTAPRSTAGASQRSGAPLAKPPSVGMRPPPSRGKGVVPPPTRGLDRPGTSGSAAPTDISYPETPRFSDVASTAAGTEVLNRLAKLEQELVQERMRREAAEQEMRRLLEQTKNLQVGAGGVSGSSRSVSKPGTAASKGGAAAGKAPAAAPVQPMLSKKSVQFTPSTVGGRKK